MPDGYTVRYDQDNLTVTNVHAPATTSKTVSKVWKDNHNQDGLRTDVTLKLVAQVDRAKIEWSTLKAASASGNEMDDDGLVTLTGKKDESYTFEHLPEKYQGKAVVYTVEEQAVPTGYAVRYDQNTLTVTNSYTPKTTKRTVRKAWVDHNNQDGLRTSVTLKLVATVDGTEVDWATLKNASASKNYMDGDGLITLTGRRDESYTFNELPEKYQGKTIVYTVLEPTVPAGYAVSYNQANLTATNTHVPATLTKTVSKAWVDNNDQDGLRTDVTLKLVATVDGAEVDWQTLKTASASSAQMDGDGLITLTGKKDESYTFENLPEKYQGKAVVYTVLEPTVPTGYVVTYDQATLTVTNSHTPATLSKTVSKAWVDNNDQDGLRTDVTLKLVATANGAEVDWATLKAASASGDQMDDDGLITLTGKKDESHTFENLPEKYQGQTVVYTVKEPTVPTGYAVTYNQANLTATNTHTPATFSKTVSKVWDDHNDQDGLRTDVTFKLVATADGAEVDWATLKAASLSGDQMDDDGLVTLTGKKNESHTFTNLPAKYLGKAVVYTVLETTVPTGYVVTYDQATLTVTNSHTPATLSRTVSKAWADNNDQDGLRTDVTLKLVATVDGAEVKWSTLKAASLSGEQMDDDGLITLTGKKDESHTFEHLPEKYQGKTVAYTVKEPTVPTGYAVTYDQATLTATNTHTPATLSKTVSKVWDDNNNQDGLRTEITLKLIATADGAEVDWTTLKTASASGAQMDEDGLVTLSGNKNESHTFESLPEKYLGKAVVYTVKETTVPVSYQESYDQNTLTVTNSYTPKTTKVSVSKKWVDEDDRYGLRADATLKLVPTVDEKEIPWATLKNASASGDQMDEDGLITLTGKVDESFTFLNLPVNYQGKKIVYTVKETPVPAGYAPTASGTQEDGLVITNTLKDIRPAVLKFHAEKTLEGRVLTGGMFSFDLKDTTKKKPELLETVTNAEDGSVDFAPITLEEVGTYSYRMTERKGHVRGFTYDKTVYDMTVELTVKTDGNGDPYFAGTPEVKKNGQPYTGAAIFANSYEEPPATIRVPIEVYKRLRGGKLKADAFAFTLYDASGKELQMVRNKEDGSVVFDARRISRPGTFVYTVKEVNEGVKSIAYDQSVYRAEIKVWQSGRELYHRIDWEKDGVPFDGEVAFRNRVKIPGTGDSALVLPMVLTSLSVALLGLSVWQKKRRKQNG